MAFVFTNQVESVVSSDLDSDSEMGEDSLDSDSDSDSEYLDMPPLIEFHNGPFHLLPNDWLD
jgi:hypothetical protein